MGKFAIILQNEFMNLIKTKKVIFVTLLYILLFFGALKLSEFIEFLAFFIPRFQQEIPYPVLLPFYFGIFVIPVVALFSIYDTISYEYENRSLKYIVYRVSRGVIIAGKYLSAFLMILLINLLLYLLSAIYIYKKTGVNHFVYSLELFLFSMIISLFFLSIGLFVTVVNRNSQRSMRYGLIIVVCLFGIKLFKHLKGIYFLSPLEFADSSINIATNNIAAGNLFIIIIYGVLAAVVYLLSWYIFDRKDLY